MTGRQGDRSQACSFCKNSDRLIIEQILFFRVSFNQIVAVRVDAIMKTLIMSRLAYLWAILALAMLNNSQVNAQNIPKAECTSNYGQVACGYNCVANYGVVRCAEWPGGVCQANYGKVVCGPPAPPNWTYLYGNGNNSNYGNNVNSTVPLISWSIYRYSVSSTECQQKSYYSLQKLGLVSLNYGEGNHIKYVSGNSKTNTARIGCLDNNTLVIFVAGSNREYVDDLRKNLITNLGLRLEAL